MPLFLQLVGAVAGAGGLLLGILAFLRTRREQSELQLKQTLQRLLATDREIVLILGDRIGAFMTSDPRFKQALRTVIGSDSDLGVSLRDRIVTLLASDAAFHSSLVKLLAEDKVLPIRIDLAIIQRDVAIVSRPPPSPAVLPPTPP
jgi:hypothetical protein